MNNLIENLIQQSTETLSGWDERRGNYKEPLFHKDKFAQLLLQQCMEICQSTPNTATPQHCAELIKNHFGIK